MSDELTPLEHFHLALLLQQAAVTVEDLLGWLDHPAPASLTDAWLVATRANIHERIGHAQQALAAYPGPLADQVRVALREAERLALAFAALLTSRPELTALPFDQWGAHCPGDLVGDLRKAERELRRIGRVLRSPEAVTVGNNALMLADLVTATQPPDGLVNRDQGGPEQAERGGESDKSRRKRGRPRDTDPKADKRIFEAWQSRQHNTYDDLAHALHTTKREVEAAIDRHRKRLKRGQ